MIWQMGKGKGKGLLLYIFIWLTFVLAGVPYICLLCFRARGFELTAQMSD